MKVVRGLLLAALNGQTNRARVCLLSDNSEQRLISARDGLSVFDRKRASLAVVSLYCPFVLAQPEFISVRSSAGDEVAELVVQMVLA